MSAKSPPPGYHTVTPAIVVRDVDAAIAFYQKAFGAKLVSRLAGPGGSVLHAEIRIGDSMIMMGEENEAWGSKSPLSTNGAPVSFHIYVDDADSAYQRALDAGATSRFPLEDAFWGDRYGKVTDPFGHEWGLATRVKEMTEEEVKHAAEEWMAGFQSGGGQQGMAAS